MKILLDECVPTPLRLLLPTHECVSVVFMGWVGVKNGALLKLAEPQFQVFITCDQNLRYQQNLAGRRIAVIQLSTNNLKRLTQAPKLIQSAVDGIQPGEVRVIDIP